MSSVHGLARSTYVKDALARYDAYCTEDFSKERKRYHALPHFQESPGYWWLCLHWGGGSCGAWSQSAQEVIDLADVELNGRDIEAREKPKRL